MAVSQKKLKLGASPASTKSATFWVVSVEIEMLLTILVVIGVSPPGKIIKKLKNVNLFNVLMVRGAV